MTSSATIGFADDELSELVKHPTIAKTLSELAKERYPYQHHMALRCLQAGFTLALEIAKQRTAQQDKKGDTNGL